MRALFINSLLIIITYIQKIKSLSEFKAFKSDNGKLVVFNLNGMFIYNNNLQIIEYIYRKNITPPLNVNVTDLNKISFSSYSDQIYFILKKTIYILYKRKFTYYHIQYDNCQPTFIKYEYEDFYSRLVLLSIQCINSYNELVIELYVVSLNDYHIYNSNNDYITEKNYTLKLPNKNMITNFSCERLYIKEEEILTCFIEFVNKIDVYSFTFDKDNTIILYSNKTISNSGRVILKTISISSYYFLICFIDYFYDNSSCIIYNLQQNKIVHNFPLNNYLSISTDLFIERAVNDFFVFCFHSSTEFTLKKIKSISEKPEYKYYTINNDLIRNNRNSYYIPFIDSNNPNSIYILLNSDVNDINSVKYKVEESTTNIIINNPNIPSNLLSFKIEKITKNIILGNIYYIIDENYDIIIYLTKNKNVKMKLILIC